MIEQSQKERKKKLVAQNRKARYEYEIMSIYEAGIALLGTEVKSLRAGKCNLSDSYAEFPNRNSLELYLLNCHISPYDFGNRENHTPLRSRKLLLHSHELQKIRTAVQEKGMTVAPLSVYFFGPYVKVEIAVVRGKKLHDKRHDIKNRDADREMRRKFE